MSTQISAYRRVASLYKWDYQKAEMALADAMAQLNRLRRTCHKLDAEIDALLDSGAGTPAAFDTSMREAVLRLVAELNGKLAAYRQAYDAQILVVLDLRKALMMAQVRKDKSLEKHREAAAREVPCVLMGHSHRFPTDAFLSWWGSAGQVTLEKLTEVSA